MESSATQQEIQQFFDTITPDTHAQVELLAPYLEGRYGDDEDEAVAGTLGHLVVEGDSAKSTKLRNVILNIPKAISDPKYREHLLEAALAGSEAALNLEHPYMMALAILVFLGKLRHLAVTELGAAEARLLQEMVLLEYEERTILKSDLEQHVRPWMPSEKLYESLIKLESLGCVLLTLDEVILNETIEIRKSSASPS